MTFWMKQQIIKTRTTRVRDAEYHIDLLTIYDEKDRNHYVLVKSLSRFWTVKVIATHTKSIIVHIVAIHSPIREVLTLITLWKRL